LSAPLADISAPVAEGDVLAGKYRVERVLGQGAMGVVVAAMHTQLQQRVALKFLTGRATREVMERFRREAQLAYKLKNQHIARVIDVGELDGGAPYMVMEYLSGQDLQQVLKSEGPMPVSEAVGFILQVCEAMAEAHSSGIVHRDLKPSNLFLTTSSDGSKMVKVLDFGISKETNDPAEGDGGMALTRTEAVLGSPLYMSMEQMKSSRDVDARADIYSLGAILYQFLSGRVPFEAQTFPELILKVASEDPPPLSTLRPDVPPPLEEAILRCLEKDRARRFPNVGELAAAIAPFATDEGIGSAERALRTFERSSGAGSGGSSPSLSAAALRNTRGSMSGSRTASSWSASTTGNQRSVSMKTIGLAALGLVLGAVTVLGVVVMTSRPSSDPASAPSASSAAAASSASEAAQSPPSSASAAAAATITPVVVPAPYSAAPTSSAGPGASASAAPSPSAPPPPAHTVAPASTPAQAPANGPAQAPANGPAQTPANGPAPARSAIAQAPPPVATPAPTPPPAATPTATQKKNPLDIDIK
jgi:eukaryotic-like serine/threonine-protein kinase